MANQFLALGMFIMLLSFFIILNAMSDYEESKSQEVLNSISVAFSKQDLPDDLSPNIKEDPVKSYHEGNTLDKLEALFNSQITGVEMQKNRLGTTMHLRMDIDFFDKQLTGSGGRAGNDLAPTLVSLLSAEDQVAYSMEMLVNLDGNPAMHQNESPEKVKAEIQRVSRYAEIIEEIGLPKKYLSTGLGKGPSGTIDLFFKRYQPFNPLGDRKKQ